MAAWFATNLVGKAIIELEEKRRNALEAANRYWAIHTMASDETVSAALKVLYDTANALAGCSLSGSIAVRMWCRLFGYDLELAAGAMRGLADGVRGRYTADPEVRKRTRNAVYVALNAAQGLSAAELEDTKAAIERAKAEPPLLEG